MTNHEDRKRVFLSSPHLSGLEQEYVANAFATNWVTPLGPHVDAFEREFAAEVGARHAVALSSGTAALHLALLLAGVGAGDEVMASTLTFVASVNPITYLGAKPVFIDSERSSWNMDPVLLAEVLEERSQQGRLPRAVVVVHLYGQSADLDSIAAVCATHRVPLIEDAAEALGASYKGRAPGTVGVSGVFSFNGNKIITTAGGGMLISSDSALIEHARKLATQARDPAPHYEHSEVGFNYRMSNILAAIGRGQLKVLHERVTARRRNFAFYEEALGTVPGIEFMPEAPWGTHTRWLTTLTIDPQEFGSDREAVRLALDAEGIEARPVWKPMHLQPLYAKSPIVGGGVADDLYARGLCLPSGSNLSESDLERVVAVVRRAAASGRPTRAIAGRHS
jgi:dTDP-4-amino-4,6-dideoxygalactose transaminase